MWMDGCAMKSARIRIGIAGAGWVATNRHLPALQALDGVDVVAIYDRNFDRARALADLASRHGTTSTAYATLSGFLAEGLDAVHVTSSPWSHHELATEALMAGAHVLVEKPMAMSPSEAEDMASYAAKHNRLLCVSHNFLYSHAMTRARRNLVHSSTSYVLGVQLSSSRRRLPTWYKSLPGGLLFDEIPHMLYTQHELLGGATKIQSATARLAPDGNIRSAQVMLTGATAEGQILMVFDSPISEWHLMCVAPGGVAGIDLFRDIATWLPPDGPHRALDIARTSRLAITSHIAGFASAGTRWITKREYWGHDILIAKFIDAIRFGRSSPVRIDDALAVVNLSSDLLSQLALPDQ
jgi:predicted dehydrogenase